VTVKSGFKCH